MASIVNNIMKEAAGRLLVASGVESVYRPTRQGDYPFIDKAVVLTHDDIEGVPELSCPGNPPKTAWILPVKVTGMIIPDDDASEAIDIAENDFGVLLMDAITADGEGWHTFGGNAIYAELTPLINFHPGDDTARAVQFTIRVTYRVDETSQATL